MISKPPWLPRGTRRNSGPQHTLSSGGVQLRPARTDKCRVLSVECCCERHSVEWFSDSGPGRCERPPVLNIACSGKGCVSILFGLVMCLGEVAGVTLLSLLCYFVTSSVFYLLAIYSFALFIPISCLHCIDFPM